MCREDTSAAIRGHCRLSLTSPILLDGLQTGARNMIGIGVATAAAGVVVGTVTLTGPGPVMTEFVEWLSGGSLIFMLFLIAVISLILGMGLPTMANYIVVSTLMAPVVVALGAQHGPVVPLIAVHLFVFYFGIMADVTPPVGLASFAASAVSGADPIRTDVQAFLYAIRTGVLPFMFIFNTELILYNVDSFFYGAWVFLMTSTAMCLFAAATQGHFVTKSRIYESVLLLLVVAFTLVRPGFWMDRIAAPFTSKSPTELEATASALEPGQTLRLRVEFLNIDDKLVKKLVLLPAPDSPPEQRLLDAGLEIIEDEGKVIIDNVAFASPAEQAGLDFDMTITAVEMPQAQPSRYWMYIPAALVVGLVVFLQRGRRGKLTLVAV